MLDNNIEEWERAQRIFGGFEAGLSSGLETLSREESLAAAEQIAANSSAMRLAADEIAQLKQDLATLESGGLGTRLDELQQQLVNEMSRALAQGDDAQIQSLASYAVAWGAAMLSAQETVRRPTAENLNASLEAVSYAESQAQGFAAASAKVKALGQIQSDLSTYVELSQQQQNSVVTNFDQLGFETGGIAEESRLSANSFSDQVRAEAAVAKDQMFIKSVIMMALALITGATLAILISRSITRPLSKIKNSMVKLSEGDTEQDIPETQRKDEIGDMAVATAVFKENFLKSKEMESEALKSSMADQAREEQKEIIDTFEQNLCRVIQALSESSDDMLEISHQLKTDAGATTAKSEAIANSADEASRSVSTVAASVEELVQSLSTMKQTMEQVTHQTADAAVGAETAEKTIDDLQGSINEIIDEVHAINDVADQTNLLALNATIEAERAGENGKGFAVVATEVKALADQTRKMTDVIADRVSALERKSSAAIINTQDIVGKIQSINGVVEHIYDTIEQQDAATREIGSAIQSASDGTTSVSADICTVQTSTESINSSSQQVGDAAKAISVNSKMVGDELNNILKTLRTA